ncbi:MULTISPECIES: hypothetical protein [unclassified Curtobacterium]|uniref:hypothetical protein n=1 Tax=unclassified Curtobacterium TaxID=257496 RepID=UPI0008DC7EE2|nr:MULTISPECIES: hypothetical protein [unclassified Curtobacterium]WIA99458.1 hypothetical protein QOL15_13165 [Curtobacterium sp. MCBA15_012]
MQQRPVRTPAVVPRPGVPLTTPGPEPTDAPEVVRALLTMRALGVLGQREPRHSSALAAQAVALGLGGPAAVALAARYTDDDPEGLDSELVDCLDELGWSTAGMSTADAAVHLTRARAAHVLTGAADGRSVAAWVNARFAWDEAVTTGAFDGFVGLHWEFEELDELAEHDPGARWVFPDVDDVAAAFINDTSPVVERWRRR